LAKNDARDNDEDGMSSRARIEYGAAPMHCHNKIEHGGIKVTYCTKMLNKRDKNGVPCHDGKCSDKPQAEKAARDLEEL